MAAQKKAGKAAASKAAKSTRSKSKATKKRKRKKPKGKRLTQAQKSIRDTLMLTRKIQGWTWEDLAAEHGLSVTAVKEAVKKKKESLPRLLDKDAAEIIEQMVEELQVSVADFEQIASAAMEQTNLPVAVGAKARADAARGQLLELLQSVGKLPNDLGTLTWVIDIRAVVVEINGSIEEFVNEVKKLDLPEDQQKVINTAADRVTGRLDEIAASPQTVTPTTDNEGGPE